MGYQIGSFEPRYVVTRIDGTPLKAGARYIVLNYASDPHARKALEVYAESIAGENPEMAAGLRMALEDPANGPAQHPWAK